MNFKQLPDKASKLCAFALSIIFSINIIFCFVPFQASAIGGIDEIATFKQKMEHNYQTVLEALIEDLNNGNLNATSSLAKQLGRSVAMQLLFTHNLTQFYDPYFEFEKDWDDIPQTINIFGSGVSGFYKYEGVTKLVNVYEFDNTSSSSPVTVVSAPDFTISAYLNPDNLISYFKCAYYDTTSGSPRYRLYYKKNDNALSGLEYYYKVIGSGIAINQKTLGTSTLGNSCYFRFSANSIPALTYLDLHLYNEFLIGGFASDYIMPDETVSTNTPWDYYNNYLLPYLIQYFNDNHIENYDKYLVFPDGYFPDPVPPSQQYPTGGGISIGNQYNFDIDINFPTYPNGEPQTDESGETITETVIVTDTRPTDAVYNFTVPTLPGLQIDSRQIPLNTDLSNYTNPLLAFFGLITDIFDASGVLPVIPILFTMGIIFFVIYKCS